MLNSGKVIYGLMSQKQRQAHSIIADLRFWCEDTTAAVAMAETFDVIILEIVIDYLISKIESEMYK
jgi:hypothetical protein